MRMFGMCLNWKVVAGLAVVGLGIWAVAPNIFAAAGPVLLVLACPLSMVFMMRGMRGMHGGQGTSGMQGDSCAMQPGQMAPRNQPELRPEERGQVEALAGPVWMTQTEQIAQLKEEMAHIQARQATIARELDELDGAVPQADPATSAVREAQAVAEDAEQRRARAVR